MKSKLLIMMLCVCVAFAEEKNSLPLPASRSVSLTLEEYNRLVDLAKKSAKARETPPVPYALKRADLKLRVSDLSVLGTVALEGEVFSKSSAKVPLTSGMTILNARQEGRPLPLAQEGTNAVAILPGQSEFALALDTGLPLVVEAGRASFTLPVPAAGSSRLSLAIPGEHTNVRLNPGLITSRTSENGQTKIEAILSPGQPANIWWTTREIAAPVVPREMRFLSDVKTLVSIGESEMRVAALADITVVQGEPAQFVVQIPSGYEITGATGAAVESSEIQSGALVLKLGSGTPRSYLFLISMERSLSATKVDTPFLSFKDAQRETGEVLIEGSGAMELTAKEGGGLKRMDLKEVSPYLRSLSRFPLQAAFRFHRQPSEVPALALEWTRFPDSAVLAAVAERATVTTLVTSEGRSLTEVKLLVKNHAQPFLKVELPAGASIVSADVAGEKVKPVQGSDGSRVPLLRAGFKPTGTYEVSFVFIHAGTPFAKKGGSELSLPKMDVPISLLEWEMFLPEQYKVKDFHGDAIAENLLPVPMVENLTYAVSNFTGTPMMDRLETLAKLSPGIAGSGQMQRGQIGGTITDPQGAVIAGARVKVTSLDHGVAQVAVTDSEGQWMVSNMPSGTLRIESTAPGFTTTVQNVPYLDDRPMRSEAKLNVAATSEVVEVSAAAAPEISGRDHKKQESQLQTQASANVYNLQKRVAGVLPVRVDVPRAGASYRFARALVLDEETKVTFAYKSK
ncbi:MAG TPA: carboxypeptidase-like regulatory domain-containing protein [Candidatus Angelobacter sp.]|nr:carboxypeptidase-like regulatory domain-containing protein [Candidatus Angelobacter sp.]